MKRPLIFTLKSVILFLIMTVFIYGTSKSTSENGFSGYIIDAKSGSSNEVFSCGEDILVTVANSTDEIATGTEVWIGHTMTLHYPDGVITSKSPSTYGESFIVVDGIVGEHATPCY